MTNETAAKVAPALPRQGVGAPESTPAAPQPAVPSASDRPTPVPLDRLLAVATLTPGQATLVAARLLRAGAAASGRAGEAGTAGCRLGTVSLTSSGDLEVAAAAATDEETPVTDLLQRLLQNARRLPAHPKPEQHLLLHRLEEAAASPMEGPDLRADGLEEALAATLGSGARRRLTAQLASLVEAAARVVPRVPSPAAEALPGEATGPTTRRTATTGSVPGTPEPLRRVRHRAAPAPAGQSRAVRRSAHLSSGHRVRRIALVVACLVAAVAAAAYLGLLDRGAGLVGSLRPGSHPTAPATQSPAQAAHRPVQHRQAHHPRGVPTLAGRHAGPVAGVALHKAGSCRPGSLCPVKVTVHLSAGSAGRPISWKVGTARLCKRQMAWAPATTVTPRPGWRTVFASSSIRIPPGRALALLALTTAPTKVQSAPVPVSGAALHC